MPKLIAALILAGSLCAACDAAEATAAASASATARASSSAGVAASPPSVAPATSVPPPTAAPKTAAPTAPPATAAPAKPAPTVSAVPTRGARGSTFVFQFSGFPTSALGVDIVQTVTLPTGAKLASTTFLANPNGTGFTTHTPTVNDPTGQYVVTLQVAGGGVSTFAIINVF